ncbi:MBOAT family protein [Theobroma cacao]|uniref:MBOAT family protein n=1 Tax=Theobroma cacao TaxID=3641 RepID=A0A061FHB5_THECC|nr:MBOAT family protein [Theobroma cacao]
MKEAKEVEGELKNFIRLCVWTMASLLYCYFIAKKIPKGLLRLISVLPVITLLSILPFDLNTLHIDILRATVYNPARSMSTRVIGPRWASLPGVFLTFLVSGLMHESLVYHLTRESPTWEVTWFFILQGVFVDVEIILKKKLAATNKFRLHRAISGPLALANIAITAAWLTYAQVVRNSIDQRVIKELNMFREFLKGMAISRWSGSKGQMVCDCSY